MYFSTNFHNLNLTILHKRFKCVTGTFPLFCKICSHDASVRTLVLFVIFRVWFVHETPFSPQEVRYLSGREVPVPRASVVSADPSLTVVLCRGKKDKVPQGSLSLLSGGWS